VDFGFFGSFCVCWIFVLTFLVCVYSKHFVLVCLYVWTMGLMFVCDFRRLWENVGPPLPIDGQTLQQKYRCFGFQIALQFRNDAGFAQARTPENDAHHEDLLVDVTLPTKHAVIYKEYPMKLFFASIATMSRHFKLRVTSHR
jgi:hypothetical protein